jgi:hypothetical protein
MVAEELHKSLGMTILYCESKEEYDNVLKTLGDKVKFADKNGVEIVISSSDIDLVNQEG